MNAYPISISCGYPSHSTQLTGQNIVDSYLCKELSILTRHVHSVTKWSHSRYVGWKALKYKPTGSYELFSFRKPNFETIIKLREDSSDLFWGQNYVRLFRSVKIKERVAFLTVEPTLTSYKGLFTLVSRLTSSTISVNHIRIRFMIWVPIRVCFMHGSLGSRQWRWMAQCSTLQVLPPLYSN